MHITGNIQGDVLLKGSQGPWPGRSEIWLLIVTLCLTKIIMKESIKKKSIHTWV